MWVTTLPPSEGHDRHEWVGATKGRLVRRQTEEIPQLIREEID